MTTNSTGNDSVTEAKKYLRENYRRGVNCPCCTRHIKEYKRTINSGMAEALVAMHRAPSTADGWMDIKSIEGVRGGDYAKLRHWELIEQRANDDEKKKDSGLWRLTLKGRRFAANQEPVPKHAYILLGEVRAFSTELMSIHQVSNFDYRSI